MPRQKTAAEAVVCGGLAGCVSKTSMAPLERARILLQVGRDTSFVVALKRVWRTEGVAGLWAGNVASILRVFPARGIAFAVNEKLRPHVSSGLGGFAAGGCAGMCAAAATYPLDLARGVLGGSGGTSIWQVLVDAWKQGGVKALYRGATPTLLGAIPFDGLRFGVVGLLRRRTPEPVESRGRAVARSAAYGGCAGLVAGVATFPNDTIRRCLQQPHHEYRGYVDCALSLVRENGVPRLYRGLAPSLIRAAPSVAIQFAAFDYFSGLVLGGSG